MKTWEISSTNNTAVKEAIRLRRKRNRYESHLFLAEGEDLLAAALESGHMPRQVFVLEGSVAATVESLRQAAGGMDAPEPPTDVYICSGPVMEKLSELGSGTRVLAVFDFIDRQLGEAAGSTATVDAEQTSVADAGDAARRGPLIYLAGVGDPGNSGSIIRSATALGASGAAFSPDAADPYSFKAQRAAMGAFFKLPFYLDVTSDEIVNWAASRGLPLVASDPHGGLALWDEAVVEGRLLAGDFVLLLGSERKGVSQELMQASQLRLRIPQLPGAESLNVAMAGTVILYEALRQRSA